MMHPQRWVQFWRQFDTDEDSGCWLWQGRCVGFPTISLGGGSVSVRELVITGKHSHKDRFTPLCGVERCACPDHLETSVASSSGGKTSPDSPALSSSNGDDGDPTGKEIT